MSVPARAPVPDLDLGDLISVLRAAAKGAEMIVDNPTFECGDQDALNAVSNLLGQVVDGLAVLERRVSEQTTAHEARALRGLR